MKKFIKFIICLILIITCIMLYSRFISTRGLKTNEILIKVENLDNSYNGLKILHFSDIHYGRTIKEEELKEIVNEINNNKPDIVVFTGDLLDKDVKLTEEQMEELINILKNIKTEIGKYIISGDNDIDDNWITIALESGFKNLNDNYELIYKNSKPIIISGISSNLGDDKEAFTKTTLFNEYMDSDNPKPIYSVLLIHEPDYLDKIDLANYNLILAGHSLGGQIRLPFIGPILLFDGAKKYNEQYYKIDNVDLYISSGLGTVNNNFRFNNKPSINFYRIVNEKSS